MNRDTPHNEVARILPRDSAALLLEMPFETQMAVLESVRNMMTDWEETGICLDPITLASVLHSFIKRLAPTHANLVNAISALQVLQQVKE